MKPTFVFSMSHDKNIGDKKMLKSLSFFCRKSFCRLFFLTALLLAPLHAQSAKPEAGGGFATASQLEEFLGAPLLVPIQKVWDKRGGWGGILTAKDGTVVAFQSPGGGTCRRSRDGGITWDAEIPIASEARNGRGLVDETTGDVLYVNPGAYSMVEAGAPRHPTRFVV